MIATAKRHRTRHRGRDFGVRAVARPLLTQRLAGGRGDDRLEDDDRAVDEEAEVDGAEAHEIAGDAEDVHAEQRDRHRGRDAEHDHERAAERAEEQRENDGDDQRALDEVRGHRAAAFGRRSPTRS